MLLFVLYAVTGLTRLSSQVKSVMLLLLLCHVDGRGCFHLAVFSLLIIFHFVPTFMSVFAVFYNLLLFESHLCGQLLGGGGGLYVFFTVTKT